MTRLITIPKTPPKSDEVEPHFDELSADELIEEWNKDFEPIHESGHSLDAGQIIVKLTAGVCGERLDKVIAKFIPQFSRSRLQQWIASGHVTVNGVAARSKMILSGDEEVVVYPQEAPEDNPYLPEPMALNIVFEDEAILVLNKPAGLVVHPAAGNWSGTLLNGLLHYCPALAAIPRAGIVHRLDKDTSGLMVVAKTLQAQTDLVRQLQARSVKREYLALVWGRPNLSGTISLPMARHPRDRIKMAVSEQVSAKSAVTHFHRIAVGELDGKPVSLVECQLETGRTHQIRVHMMQLGFSLVGDPLYGKPHLAAYFSRQALQAYRLGFIHPGHHKECIWQIELAQNLSDLLLRAGINYVN